MWIDKTSLSKPSFKRQKAQSPTVNSQHSSTEPSHSLSLHFVPVSAQTNVQYCYVWMRLQGLFDTRYIECSQTEVEYWSEQPSETTAIHSEALSQENHSLPCYHIHAGPGLDPDSSCLTHCWLHGSGCSLHLNPEEWSQVLVLRPDSSGVEGDMLDVRA